ncbi:MAG: gliding motility-associated C-terminal domain-containing protein [Bacteroidetes bacterium]|nr:gliding motility-associated C-terminal domain-containing protein [Bacteroidota bacterium]
MLILTRFFITVMAIFFLNRFALAQKDSITYNSTCSNYKITFSSNLFDSIGFPDKVKWNFGDPASGFYNSANIQSPTHLFASPGIYPLTLIVINGGDSITISDSINIVSPIAYNFGPDMYLCSGADTTIYAPSIPGARFEWNDDSLTRTAFLKVAKTGIYTVKVNGCAVSDSIGIYYSDTPHIKLGNDHVMCAGEVLTLNAASQNAVYTWKLNGAILPNDTLAQLATTAPGGQYISIVNVPGCGIYSDTANITFSSLPAPPFSLGPDTLLCPKEIYTLTANAAGATAYNWSTGATGSSIQITEEGQYWAFVTINNQCEVVDTVQVTYRGDKNLNFHDTAICKGSTLVLNADFGTGTYNWVSDPPQRNDQNQTGQSTYYVYEPGKYKVVASVGRCSYTDSLRVSFNDSLYLNIGRDTSLCNGEQFLLHVSTNANSFAWQDESALADYPVKNAGTYSVIAQNGCGRDTATVKIVFRACECELTLPDAFTPNGDGVNEIFRPLHPCNMADYRMQIFNRYGQLIFESSDPSRGWNGTYGGLRADNGTYIWMSSYTNTDTRQKKLRRGTVILVR